MLTLGLENDVQGSHQRHLPQSDALGSASQWRTVYAHVSNHHAILQEGNNFQGFQLEAEAPSISDPRHRTYVRHPLHESVRSFSIMSGGYIYA
jgi:hypothetical protein